MYATFFAYVNSAYFFQCIVDYWVFASASQLMTIIVKASAQLNRGRQQCRRCVGVDIAVAVADVAVAVVAVAWLLLLPVLMLPLGIVAAGPLVRLCLCLCVAHI